MIRFRVLLSLLLLNSAPLLAQTPDPAGPSDKVTGRATADEGDLIKIESRRFRLWGIDAPDLDQTCRTKFSRVYECGVIAREQMASMLKGREVTCEVVAPTSARGEEIAVCRAGGKDLAGALVVRGWAFAAIRLAHDYTRLQSHAQAAKAGMWAGRVEAPWLWRSKKIPGDTTAPPPPALTETK